MVQTSILLISAEKASGDKLEAILRSGGAAESDLLRVDALFDGLRHLQERAFDIIITDLFMPDGQGVATLRHLQQHAPATPAIVVCNSSDRETAIQAVRKGAYNFFLHEELDGPVLRKSIETAIRQGEEDADKRAADRRTNARFPCRLAVSYQTLEHPIRAGQGVSETLNISSKGLLFTTNDTLEAGQLVQVSLEWPAMLENQIPLKLVAEGRIVRNSQGQTAMTIDKYEFRTRRIPRAAPAATAAKN
ncbi:MAG: response regulator receiver sensor signal transduction histidine kinase [Bryobacterales bacterium]|nr:response regulator receiver sensor signal transduction histidine kinase [Bryobacterales bacterium]